MQSQPTFVPLPPPPAKKSRKTLIIVLSIIGGIILLCCGGGTIMAVVGAADSGKGSVVANGDSTGSTNSTKKSGPLTAKLGETVEYKTSSGKKIRVTITGINRQAQSNNQFVTPKKGGFVTVQVSVTYLEGGSGTYVALPTDFSLIGADGTVYGGDIMSSAGFDGAMDTVTLNIGQKASGLVAFDVDRANISGGKIQLNDFGKAAAFWAIP